MTQTAPAMTHDDANPTPRKWRCHAVLRRKTANDANFGLLHTARASGEKVLGERAESGSKGRISRVGSTAETYFTARVAL